jgi:hypothetical protein
LSRKKTRSRVEEYETAEQAGGEIIEYERTPIPRILILLYILLPLIGIGCMILSWKGSHPWFDRGHWHHLQQAANTTSNKIAPT